MISPDLEGRPRWVPHVDMVAKNGDELIIKVDLASLKRENLDLIVEGNHLTIAGHRPSDEPVHDCEHFVTEIPFGRFERTIEIPAAFDLSAASANYTNGMLRVCVPRRKPEPPRW